MTTDLITARLYGGRAGGIQMVVDRQKLLTRIRLGFEAYEFDGSINEKGEYRFRVQAGAGTPTRIPIRDREGPYPTRYEA